MKKLFVKQKKYVLVVLLFCIGAGAFLVFQGHRHTDTHSIESPLPNLGEIIDPELGVHPRLRGLSDWQRPEGPWKVALQVGHWQASDAPEEQQGLRQSTGTSWGRVTEWEVNLAIAEATKRLLEGRGVVVELLPTTIPPNYWADVFISIHADGNTNTGVSGYKTAASRLDQTGKAEELSEILKEEYGLATRLKQDTNITRTMRGYYAFNWRRYDHSLHPMTAAVIIETGFLTNPADRQIIVRASDQAASGIANGVIRFFGSDL